VELVLFTVQGEKETANGFGESRWEEQCHLAMTRLRSAENAIMGINI